jgi:hypothetical protein
MPATIKIKNSSTASAVPTSSDLVQGELAVNVTDKRLFTENASGTVVELGTNPSILTLPDGSASAPTLTNDGDTNTGLFFPAADTVGITTGGSERLRVDSSGNLGVGSTSPNLGGVNKAITLNSASSTNCAYELAVNGVHQASLYTGIGTTSVNLFSWVNGPLVFGTNNTERARIDSSGNLLVGMTSASSTSAGFYVNQSTLANTHILVANTRVDGSGSTMFINRQGSDGTLIEFRQADTAEGSISVSGTTVSYNGGHLARYAQTVGAKDESIKKGTVLSNLDEMNTYTDSEDNPIANEQLNKVKVSDVEGDVNVAGVFVNWSHDEKHEVDEINMAMTGDMIIRIAQGTTVARGDLLMSAGDGTAKPQGDDIVRAKTVAKVTSTHVTCTYEDGSYCVPCVLMAC